MKECIIALIDCDSFFVSCEQSVNKDLLDKPVCVVGNERGCVLARSREAKAMGVPMGHPYFMAKKEFPECIYVFSNYTLYHDISCRVMSVLRDFSPTVEVYSVDEAFIELSGLKKLYNTNYLGIAKLIREKIKTEIGINVSIGLSSSKVLAKLACEKAKKSASELRARKLCLEQTKFVKTKSVDPLNANEQDSGIYLIGKRKIPKELKSTKVQEIWGIGKNTTLFFNRWGVLTCDKLVEKSDEWLKTKIGKRGVELKHELLGQCIDEVKSVYKLPKSIQNTRSFPNFTNDLNYIKNALNAHIHTSCRKLRRLKGNCKTVSVMLRTKDFAVYWDKVNLPKSTSFELDVSKEAMKLLEKMYLTNIPYRSCGVTLENIDYNPEEQLTLFAEKTKHKNCDKLAQAIDKLEEKFGRNVVTTGFMGE